MEYAELKEQLDRIEKCLAQSCKQILTIEELSNYMGISKSRIYSLCSSREIPHYKQGKLYFLRKEIDEWLTVNKIMTKEEIRLTAQTYCTINKL